MHNTRTPSRYFSVLGCLKAAAASARPAVLATALAAISLTPAFAGNEDRVGQAGATELLINPWARSAGWAGLNTASINGIESERFNIAGMAFNPTRNEINFSQSQWLQGSGVGLSSFGYARQMKGEAVLGVSFMSVNFGDIPVTSYLQPELTAATYRPQFFNLGISYAKKFSESIYGGAVIRLISQSIPDVNAQGVAFDAGIRYHLPGDRLKFGIALRNIGTPMQFSGTGLSFRSNAPNSAGAPQGEYTITVEQRAERFELPSMMNLGIAYDIISQDTTRRRNADSSYTSFSNNGVHGVSVVGNFTTNSFSQDQYGVGVEYRYKSWLGIRTGYNYEKRSNADNNSSIGSTTNNNTQSAHTGFAAGATLQAPLIRERNVFFAIDYSYRASNPFGGTHSIGARFLF